MLDFDLSHSSVIGGFRETSSRNCVSEVRQRFFFGCTRPGQLCGCSLWSVRAHFDQCGPPVPRRGRSDAAFYGHPQRLRLPRGVSGWLGWWSWSSSSIPPIRLWVVPIWRLVPSGEGHHHACAPEVEDASETPEDGGHSRPLHFQRSKYHAIHSRYPRCARPLASVEADERNARKSRNARKAAGSAGGETGTSDGRGLPEVPGSGLSRHQQSTHAQRRVGRKES